MFNADLDPDPGFHLNADPDPLFSMTLKADFLLFFPVTLKMFLKPLVILKIVPKAGHECSLEKIDQ